MSGDWRSFNTDPPLAMCTHDDHWPGAQCRVCITTYTYPWSFQFPYKYQHILLLFAHCNLGPLSSASCFSLFPLMHHKAFLGMGLTVLGRLINLHMYSLHLYGISSGTQVSRRSTNMGRTKNHRVSLDWYWQLYSVLLDPRETRWLEEYTHRAHENI